MAIRGSLREASLPDVLQLLAMGKKTGCLSVTHRDDFGYIYFDRGRITFASIVNRRDRIGDLLVNAGAITRAQLDEALAAQHADPARRLGDFLLELGLVPPDSLREQVRVQIEEAVYYLFTWSNGTFSFEPDVRPDEQDALVSINPESLLLEGARRVDEWSQIAKKVPSLDVVFDVDGERLRTIEATLAPAQQTVLALIDGHRDVRTIVEESGLGEFEVGQVLFAFASAGVARRAGVTRAAEPAVSDNRVDEHRNLGIAFYKTGMLDEALREFRRVAELRPADPRAPFYIGLVLMRQGKWPAAADVYRQAAADAAASPAVLHNLAYVLERLGRFDEAEAALERAASRGGGDDPRVRTSLAVLALRRGAVADAESMLRAARPLWGTRPPPAAWFHYAGLAAALTGDLEGAASVLAEGVRQYPRAGALYANLAAVHERRGAHVEAAAVIERGLQEDGTRPQLHKAAGDHAYRGGRYEEALEAYQRAARLQPTLGSDVYLRIGNLRYRRGEIDQAQQAWTRALELDGDNDIARSNLETLRRLSRVSA